MSTTKTSQIPPQSPQDVPRTSETPKPGFDCRKEAESFLGLKLRGEERVKYLESLFSGAAMAGHDCGYQLGQADGRAQALLDAGQSATKEAKEIPAKPIRSLSVRVSRVDTQQGCLARLSFPDIPGLHFVSEYPSRTETGFDVSCYALAIRNGDVLNFRPI